MVWAAACHFTPVGASSMRSAKVEFRAKGGEILHLSDAERAELMAKMRPVGDDIVKSKPDLKPLWDLLLAAAARAK